jgi:hypothetical protein
MCTCSGMRYSSPPAAIAASVGDTADTVGVFIRRGGTVPSLEQRVVLRAWRHRGESGRIHYMAVYADGRERHLYVDEDHPLYAVLDSHLLAVGYTGPTSGADDGPTSPGRVTP